MPEKRYLLPGFLQEKCSQTIYERWLRRKAAAHVRRDRKRRHRNVSGEEYRMAIHQAVMENKGKDDYTGAPLDWSLISRWNNDESKLKGRKYKKEFGDLPTVDHVEVDGVRPVFKICSWRVNDCKNDLTLEEFRDVCMAFLSHNH